MAVTASAGIDAEAVRRTVRDHLAACLAAAPQRPAGLPETIEQYLDAHPVLAEYRAVLDGQVASLVAEIKEDLRETGVLLEGVEDIPAYDVTVVGAYGQPPDEVARLTRDARQRSRPHQQVRVGFRLGGDPPGCTPAIGSSQQARQCVEAAAGHGADSVLFYNYSESPEVCLSWIKPAIAGMIDSGEHV